MLGVTLVGVFARRRWASWYTFGAFVIVVFVTTLMIAIWPDRFYTQAFWRPKETALNLLRFAMALELALRTFRAFPGALSTLRWVVLFVLGTTFATVIAVGSAVDDRTFVGELQPRVVNGSIWLFTAIAALILWYRLPVQPFRKAILLSYVPYLLIFTVAMNALVALGWERAWPLRYANQLAYLTLVSYWSYAAWRRVEAPTPMGPALSA